jgi:hypothetical protein
LTGIGGAARTLRALESAFGGCLEWGKENDGEENAWGFRGAMMRQSEACVGSVASFLIVAVFQVLKEDPQPRFFFTKVAREMTIDKRKMIRAGLIAAVVFTSILAGEWLVEGLIEFADLLLELSQAVLSALFEAVLELDHGEAQQKAAWTTLLLGIAFCALALRWLIPWGRRRAEAIRGWMGQRAESIRSWWKSMSYFKKAACFAGGVLVLMGLGLIL